ncbi:MAG: leucine-rich repeat protein [Lachnospiraceae bacterium]|nr:leucine-rich repeat protein [Lachnospiraceae bacterium]
MDNIEFEYIDLNDKEICITGIKSDDISEELRVLEIPGEIDGKRVTETGAGNFNIKGLFIEEIILPDTVEKIGEFSFAYMVNLRRIVIPNSVKYIGEGFITATAAESVEIPESVEELVRPDLIESAVYATGNRRYSADGYGIYENEYISDTGEYIGKVLIGVNGADLRTEYSLNDDTVGISGNALRVTKYLEKLIIPKNTTYIEEGALSYNGNISAGYTGIKEVIIDKNNPTFFAENNAVFKRIENNKYLLVRSFERGNEYTVKEGTAVLGYRCFSDSPVNELRLPDSVKEIHKEVFDGSYIHDFYLNGGKVRIYFYKDNRFELEDMQEGFGKNGRLYDYTYLDGFLLKESLTAERIKMIAVRLTYPVDIDAQTDTGLRNRIKDNIFDVVDMLVENKDIKTVKMLGDLDIFDDKTTGMIIDIHSKLGHEEITAWFMEFQNKLRNTCPKEDSFCNGFLEI